MASVSAIWGDLKELGRIFEGFLEGFWKIYGGFRKGFKKDEEMGWIFPIGYLEQVRIARFASLRAVARRFSLACGVFDEI